VFDPDSGRQGQVYECLICEDQGEVIVPGTPVQPWPSAIEAYELLFSLSSGETRLRICPACRPVEARKYMDRLWRGERQTLTESDAGWLAHVVNGQKDWRERLCREVRAAGGSEAWGKQQFAKVKGWIASKTTEPPAAAVTVRNEAEG